FSWGGNKDLAALPCLGLILLLWSQGPGVQGQEFQFGPCRVEGIVLQELWEAFWDMKDVVQAQDNITNVRLLRKEVLQNVSEAESCYLIHSLLKFYLNTIFKNYREKAVKFRILRSFSTLANNFVVIMSKLQPSVRVMGKRAGSGHQHFWVQVQVCFKPAGCLFARWATSLGFVFLSVKC
uniref:Interleukin-24 n=1 Tax=Sus scrofa TaxID=9823 RepID=A0A8D0YDY6_PIG